MSMSHLYLHQVQVLRAHLAKQSPHNSYMSLRGTKQSSTIRRLLRCLVLDTVSKNTRPTRPAAPRNDILFIFLLSSFILFSCSTSAPQPTPQPVSVYSTSAAQPWLTDLYVCGESSALLSRIDDPSTADIVLRVGEPEFLASPAYQIDEEEILIVTHRQSPVQNLTLEEARALFAEQGDASVQVWVYASEEDVQKVFDQAVMAERSVASSARLAVNPQEMSDTLVNQANAVGVLPRHWKVGDVREVFSVATVPVLAITQSEPQGVIKELIACLQSK
jgi:hypothetical protein